MVSLRLRPRHISVGSLAAVFVLGVSSVSAAPLVAGDDPAYRLGGHLEIFRDGTGTKTLADVEASSAWKKVPQDEPSLGFTTAVSWARFQVQSAVPRTMLLTYSWANVDRVNAFVISPDGAVEEMSSGISVPFAARSVPYRYPVFPIKLPAGRPVWCYVQVKDVNSLFPLSLWNEAAFQKADHDRQGMLGLFFGLFLVAVLINASFYLATRDRAYLYYVCFVLFYLIFEMTWRGIAGEYIWPRHTGIDDAVEVTASSLAITMGLLFTRKFLETRTWAPAADRILRVFLAAAVVNSICTLVFPFLIMVQITNILLLFSAAALIPITFIVFRRGFRPARFYLLAWVMLLCGCMIFALLNFGLVPSNGLTRNALSLGGSLEMILLLLAVIDRYLLLRRESERNQRERLDAVEKRLYSDSLTELPNRTRLVADLQSGRPVTIILVNIDHFKEINDSFGQKAGDAIIKELGCRVRRAAEAYRGSVYRLHADEFALLVDSPCDDATLAEIGRLLVSLCQDAPYRYQNEILRLDVSVGAAVAESRHLEKADMALSVSRSKKTFVHYRPELEVVKRYAENFRWLHVIRESIEQDRIIPFFQPILNNESGAIEKFESLMRIRMNDGSVIAPAAFLTIAKKSKIYPELSRRMIEKTAGVMRTEPREVAVNISLEDILHPDVRGVIDRITAESDLGRHLVFELLESEGIENYDEVSRFIELMKEKGAKIAIDDFGAGYSNFEHILRLRVDYLKLDSSLIRPIATDANARCIVETIVSFARRLGIQTIAEFVHTKAVQDIVRSIGVTHSQGYFIGQPSPACSDYP
jgi:diguanylate cyclase (GGDEF)-like protein